jgi:hypothetical protein
MSTKIRVFQLHADPILNVVISISKQYVLACPITLDQRQIVDLNVQSIQNAQITWLV